MKLTNDWITGFVDGDGCFSISQINRKKMNETPLEDPNFNAPTIISAVDDSMPTVEKVLRFRLIVSQDHRSTDVLYAFKKHFGCGTVCKSGGGGNMMAYSVTNRLHLRDRIIPHFLKYPLQTMKRIPFYKFATTLHHYMKSLGEDAGVVVDPLYVSAEYNITAGWFRGIVDADGCFSFSIVKSSGRCMPRFTLGMQRGEGELLKECQRFLSCGTLHRRKDGFETLQVASVAHMEERLIPLFETRGSAVLLRTIKRVSFQKWRKIVRLMGENRHLDQAGLEKIKKYQGGLNKYNESLGLKTLAEIVQLSGESH